jgi:glycine/D-amino acid oxidase-like deaminating enzyme
LIAFDVCVVGAGVFGAWTARSLVDAGARVALVDAWGPAHARASSGGESRVLRYAYGDDAIYTRMAWRSLPRWRALAERTDTALVRRTGVLWLAAGDDPTLDASRRALAADGVPCETLAGDELAHRFPQMRFDEGMEGLYEPEGSVALARRAVQALVGELVVEGVELRLARALPLAGHGRLERLATDSGDAVAAGRFVFACGPWLGKVFPALLGPRLFPTRQEVHLFAPPAGDRRFAPPHFPAWLDGDFYGVPDLEGRGVKVASDRHGEPFDPDAGDRRPTAEAIAAARAFLARRLPDLAAAPLTETRVCQYENSANGDFLIDRHPDLADVWLVGGGSGHGFKHGPAVGETAARMVLDDGAAAEPRFSLATKAMEQTRAVH